MSHLPCRHLLKHFSHTTRTTPFFPLHYSPQIRNNQQNYWRQNNNPESPSTTTTTPTSKTFKANQQRYTTKQHVPFDGALKKKLIDQSRPRSSNELKDGRVKFQGIRKREIRMNGVFDLERHRQYDMPVAERDEILRMLHHFLSLARKVDASPPPQQQQQQQQQESKELIQQEEEDDVEKHKEDASKEEKVENTQNNNITAETNTKTRKQYQYRNRRDTSNLITLKRYKLYFEQEGLHNLFQECFNQSKLGKALVILEHVRQPLLDLISSDSYVNYDRWFYAEILVKYYNFVIATAGKIYDLETAERVFHQLKNETHVQPNCGSYTSLLNSCSHMNEFGKFDRYMKDSRMKQPYTQRIYHSLMLKSFLQKKYNEVLTLYMDMRKRKILATSGDIIMILMEVVRHNSKMMGEADSVQAVRYMLDSALKGDLPPEKKEYVLGHSIIIILDINPRLAVTVLEESAQLMGFGLTNHIFSKLIYKHLSDKKDPEAVRAIWKYVKDTNFQMDPLSLDSALYIATISSMEDMCEDIWNYYFSGKLVQSIKTLLDPGKFFVKLMQYAALIGSIEKADLVLKHMEEIGVAPKGSLYCYYLRCHLCRDNVAKLQTNAMPVLSFVMDHHMKAQRAPIESISFFNYAMRVALEDETPNTFFYMFNVMEKTMIQRRSGFAWYKTFESLCKTLILCCMRYYSTVYGTREEALWMRIFHYLVALLNETKSSPLLREQNVPDLGKTVHVEVRACFVDAVLLSLKFFKRHHLDNLHEEVRLIFLETEKVIGPVHHELAYFAEQQGFHLSDFRFYS